MAQLGMAEEIGVRFGWQRPEAEEEIYLVLARKCVRVPREWPPLEVPGQAPLDGLELGCGTDCWEAGSGGAMIQRDPIDW